MHLKLNQRQQDFFWRAMEMFEENRVAATLPNWDSITVAVVCTVS